jgi:hypothetical protein
MAKFDPDYAIFGTLSADIEEDKRIGDAVVDYINRACTKLFGEIRGRTISELFVETSGSTEKGHELLTRSNEKGLIAFEGNLT